MNVQEMDLGIFEPRPGENDRILVFFAGHGETMKLPDGGEMGYLLPVDGRQENLYASAIPMNDLKDLSHMSKAKHMLFLVDACYGGLAAVGSRGLEPAKTPNYIEKITNIKSRQIITAGGKDEKVFEKSEWGHSAYTKNLLSALEDGYADSNGDGYITADELGDYLSEKVSIDSENQQTPQSRRLTSHEGEFIFIANNIDITINNESPSTTQKQEQKLPDKDIVPDTSNDDLEDISWENMFMKMTSVYNFDSVIDEEYWFVMGISLPFKIKSFDNTRIAAFTNSEDNYNDAGLYLELNKYIYKELLSLNINLGFSASNYKFEATNYTDTYSRKALLKFLSVVQDWTMFQHCIEDREAMTQRDKQDHEDWWENAMIDKRAEEEAEHRDSLDKYLRD